MSNSLEFLTSFIKYSSRLYLVYGVCFRNLWDLGVFLLLTWRQVRLLGWQACFLCRWVRRLVPCSSRLYVLVVRVVWWAWCRYPGAVGWRGQYRLVRSPRCADGRRSGLGFVLWSPHFRSQMECCPILCWNSTVEENKQILNTEYYKQFT